MMNPKPSEEQGHFLTLNACNIPTLGRHSKAGRSLLEKAMKCINALYTPPFFVDYETKKQFSSQTAVQVQTWCFPRPERHYCSYLKEENKHRRKCAVFEQKETVTALTEASSREKSIKGICFIIFAQSSIKTPCCHTSWQLRSRKRKARLHLAGIICGGTKQQKAGIPKRNLSFFPHFFFPGYPHESILLSQFM